MLLPVTKDISFIISVTRIRQQADEIKQVTTEIIFEAVPNAFFELKFFLKIYSSAVKVNNPLINVVTTDTKIFSVL